MLSVAEALAQVLERSHSGPVVSVPLGDALGLVLAEDVTSDVDSPPYDKSQVDGYAVIAADLAGGRADLELLEEVTAGNMPSRRVTHGTTTRIMTGAPLPEGADAVVMIERSHVVAGDGCERVQLTDPRVVANQNIMRRSTSMALGDLVLTTGCVLRAVEIGLLAEVGCVQVRVIERPTLAVLATGNELVTAAKTPVAGQIRNSNGPMLVASAVAAGARAVELGIGRDEPAHLRELIAQGLEADVLVIAGGVSAGVLDLVPSVLDSLGVEQVFHKVDIKPGKPLWFGISNSTARPKLVFGLPGNPVSSLVCFEVFVRPAIGRLGGRDDTQLAAVEAELADDYVHRGSRPTYHPARLTTVDGRHRVELLRWRGSGDLRTLTAANALACFPGGDRELARGAMLTTLRLPR